LKNAASDHLAADGGEHLVFARVKDLDLGNFDLLMELLCFELRLFPGSLLSSLLVRRFQEHLLEQVRIIKTLWVTFQECQRRQFGLLRVQILGFLELQQRAQVIGAGRIDDDDPFPLLELRNQVIAVDGRQNQDGDGGEEPEPREPVALDKEPGRVEGPAWL